MKTTKKESNIRTLIVCDYCGKECINSYAFSIKEVKGGRHIHAHCIDDVLSAYFAKTTKDDN